MKKRMTARLKGAFFITRQANHHMVHLLLGVLWFYFVRRSVPELGPYHLFLAILGSELPDIEHLFYFYMHGKKDSYSLQVRFFIRHRMWRELSLFLKNNHKHLTKLKFHCLQWILIHTVLTGAGFLYDHFSAVILLGAMVTHYCFDVVDDIIFLGRINPNWKKGIIRSPKF
jgi:hypothetical protein